MIKMIKWEIKIQEKLASPVRKEGWRPGQSEPAPGQVSCEFQDLSQIIIFTWAHTCILQEATANEGNRCDL